MLIWRIIKSRYKADGLSGEGARVYGGRWTSPGHPVIYCAQHLSLAVLEIFVHIRNNVAMGAYSKLAIEVGEDRVSSITLAELPHGWDAPFPEAVLQRIGDKWLEAQQSLILQIPSSVIHEEHNYLINPLHPDFASLAISRLEPMPLDTRLVSSACNIQYWELPLALVWYHV
ncbi:RES family NAD+ phosphorylase, partial [bacterium]|nr:RES family NAD+ phosphorylase [bacterium]